MREQINSTKVKIERLTNQLSATEELAFPYADSKLAIQQLRNKLGDANQRLRQIDGMSADLQKSALRDVNITLVRVSKLAGIISRAANIRNPFEFYRPLILLCRTLVDKDVRLILSAEYDYIPFTYPLSSSELPNFIIIGLPVSEAENVLIFPLAGHELGHSVWRRFEIDRYFERDIEKHVYQALEDHRQELSERFPEVKTLKPGQSLDESPQANTVAAECAQFVSVQIEEIFADLFALLLFRESYLHAFRYLVAPTVSQRRYSEYPPTKERATLLAHYAERANISIGVEFVGAFVDEAEAWDSTGKFLNKIVDRAAEKLRDSMFSVAESRLRDLSQPASDGGRDNVKKYFELGIPFDKPTSLGDLVNAAWAIVRSNADFEKLGGLHHGLSDLVLKSAELGEFSELFDAKQE